MNMKIVDPKKHPDVNKYRRALILMVIGVLIGVGLTFFGIFVAEGGITGMRAWLIASTVIGPSIIFLSTVAFATYMENIEKERYGGVYEEYDPRPHKLSVESEPHEGR